MKSVLKFIVFYMAMFSIILVVGLTGLATIKIMQTMIELHMSGWTMGFIGCSVMSLILTLVFYESHNQ